MATIEQNGTAGLSVVGRRVRPALLDVAGRAVSRIHALGPKSIVADKGVLHEGAYIAQITSGGKKFREMISIVR